MRIALMTWFQYSNYGSALQVTAMQNILESLGHEVKIIQYYHGKTALKLPEKPIMLECIDKFFQRVSNLKKRDITDNINGKIYCEYRNNVLKLTERCDSISDLKALNNKYDVFICGSDQIWSPLCFDEHYFLDFVFDPNKIMAYAPSIGVTEICNKEIKKQMKTLISRFKYLSVREKSGVELIKKMTGQEATLVLDPTLLMSSTQWMDVCNTKANKEEKYLLTYFLGQNEKYWKQVYKIAESKELKVKIIPVFSADFRRKGDVLREIGPAEFVSCIKNADFICTDSFHGVAFSINFSKQFYCFKRFAETDIKNQNTRIYNILNLLNLENRLYNPDLKKTCYEEVIDYGLVFKKLDKLREQSNEFLINSLEEMEENTNHNLKIKKLEINENMLCCGCGACASVCPKNAIEIKQSLNGFYEAVIDEEKCVSCSRCIGVCPFYKNDNAKDISKCKLYSYKTKDTEVLMKSSSGGAAYQFSKYLMNKGYSIAGCTFDEELQKAKHILIKPNEFQKLCMLQGSKYMQSEYSLVMKELIDCSTPVVVFGTPCQIAATKNILKDKKDVIYIDLICHGVPSYHLYDKYKRYLKNKYNLQVERLKIVFRYKPMGWRQRYIYTSDSNKESVQHQSKDKYFLMFEHGNCYSKACYECRWRNKSSADLRIGDYWGDRFENDLTGVSMVLAMTKTGQALLDKWDVDKNIELKEQTVVDYIKFQQMDNIPRPSFYDEVMEELKRDDNNLSYIVKKYVTPFETKRKIVKVYEKIKSKIRRK